MEKRKGVGGTAGTGGGSWFVHVRFYVPADVRLLIYDSLAHSEARNFRFISLLSSPREIRTMILLSTCSGSDPRKQQETEKGAEEGRRMTIFRESLNPPNVFTRQSRTYSRTLATNRKTITAGKKMTNILIICKTVKFAKGDREQAIIQAFPQK